MTILRALNILNQSCKLQNFTPQTTTKRSFYGWLNNIFNRVDQSRIDTVGPDRACAEWLLRCGASVKWVNSSKFIKDYNSLPVGGGRGIKIEEVDATDSAIMEVGFPHFSGLTHFRKLTLNNCS